MKFSLHHQHYIQKIIVALLLGGLCLSAGSLRAEQNGFQNIDSPRFILHLDKEDLSAPGANGDPRKLAARAMDILDAAASELQVMLPSVSSRKIQLRFLSPERFTREARAPRWATGVYFRGEILVPVGAKLEADQELERTLRHEYLHAVTAELTDSRCPAWLDEGLAQIFEQDGDGRPQALLSSWMKRRRYLPLRQLKEDFESPDRGIAAAAYAESFFAADRLMRQYGFARLIKFFEELRKHRDQAAAFEAVYPLQLEQFENDLADEVRSYRR